MDERNNSKAINRRTQEDWQKIAEVTKLTVISLHKQIKELKKDVTELAKENSRYRGLLIKNKVKYK